MAKATHQGTCQICGATQKLPGGVLSLHGYTTRWGFFSGVCNGSRHLPFEVSSARVASAIESAGRQAAELRTRAEQLRQPTPSTRVCVRVWVRAGRSASGYQEITGDLIAAEKPSHGQWFQVLTDNGQAYFVDFHTPVGNVALAVAAANDKHAKRLEATARQLDEYADWQRQRLAAWAPAELTAL